METSYDREKKVYNFFLALSISAELSLAHLVVVIKSHFTLFSPQLRHHYKIIYIKCLFASSSCRFFKCMESYIGVSKRRRKKKDNKFYSPVVTEMFLKLLDVIN